jgi:hypothetical protein
MTKSLHRGNDDHFVPYTGISERLYHWSLMKMLVMFKICPMS